MRVSEGRVWESAAVGRRREGAGTGTVRPDDTRGYSTVSPSETRPLVGFVRTGSGGTTRLPPLEGTTSTVAA